MVSLLRLLRHRDFLEAKIAPLPPGNLVIRKQRYGAQQFYRDGKRVQVYIPRKDLPMIKALYAEKAVLTSRLKVVTAQINTHSVRERRKAEALWRHKKKAFQLARAKPYGDQYRHYTLHGEYVISKSEVILADYLYLHRIPYEYEKPLPLENTTYYPDFTLFVNDKVYYLEHLGMLTDAKYRSDWRRKRLAYNRNGIIEGVNLICTREICGAIDMQEIDRTFREMHIIK